MLGATSGEAATARGKLLKLLQDYGTHGTICPTSSPTTSPRWTMPPARDPVTPPDVNPLDLVMMLIESHIAVTEDERLAVSLWILHTYVYDRYRESPRLALLSAGKRLWQDHVVVAAAVTDSIRLQH